MLPLRCNVLITLALSELLVTGLPEAESRLREADAVAVLLHDPLLTARVAFQRASIAGRVGDLAAAWESMQVALALPEAFTARERVALLLNRGMLALETARVAEALESFRRAAEEARVGGFTMQERMARHNEGYAQYLLGDLPTALRIMAEATAIAPAQWFGAEVLDRSRVLLEAGLVTDALDELAHGSHRSGEQSRQQIADFELEAARALLLQGRLEAAAEAARTARVGYERVGAQAWANRARLVELQVDLNRVRLDHADPSPDPQRIQAGRTELVMFAAQAADVAARASAWDDVDTIRAAAVLRADLLLAAGDVAGAKAHLARGQRTRSSLTSELAHTAVRAEIAIASGQRGSARRLLSAAAAAVAVAQRSSASIDVRTATAVHGIRLARTDLALALDSGSASVLRSLERWRAGSDHLPHIDRPADPELGRLTEQLRAVQLRIHRGGVDEGASLSGLASSLQQRIRARDWALGSTARHQELLGDRIATARRVLRERDRDLVWFFTHGNRLMGLGSVGGQVRVRDLMSRADAVELAHWIRVDLRSVATRDLGPFAAAVRGSLRAAATALDERLVAPWRVRASGLVIVTCEEVSALPWSLLPSLSGRPVGVSASLTSFARRVRPGPRDRRALSVDVGVGPNLPRAHREALAVAHAWRRAGSSVRVFEPSSAAETVRTLTSPGVVHVAAHGTHQKQSPLFSSVALHDGPVFAHELQASGVAADHVVLSACEVGSATFRPGEEQLGLAAAMLALGAATVVAAVSPVPDDVAATVMERHHVQLAAGADSDAALAQAVMDLGPAGAAFVHLGGQFRL